MEGKGGRGVGWEIKLAQKEDKNHSERKEQWTGRRINRSKINEMVDIINLPLIKSISATTLHIPPRALAASRVCTKGMCQEVFHIQDGVYGEYPWPAQGWSNAETGGWLVGGRSQTVWWVQRALWRKADVRISFSQGTDFHILFVEVLNISIWLT